MNKRTLLIGTALAACATIVAPTSAYAQQGQTVDEANVDDPNVIVVTARKTSEDVQDVPDAVSVFTEATIEETGIDEIQDFINLVPNIGVREQFRAGVTFITIRGINSAQQGWAPVTFVVDGVQAGSLDAINQGALTEIQQIEVLKGPQSALYGAGAIGGAINVVTKAPSNDFEVGGKLSYAKGNDFKSQAAVSGPIVEDKLLGRLGVYYRNTDGLIDSQNDVDLDFEEHIQVNGRLIFNATDNFSIDLRGKYSDIEAGAAFQSLVPDLDSLDLFDPPFEDPVRGDSIGSENREFTELSAKIEWEADFGTLTSVTGYSDINQDFFQSASFTVPPLLGAPDEPSFCGPIRGQNAAPGELNDCLARLVDNFRTITQDIRFSSPTDQPFRWLIGASYLDRRVLNRLAVGGFFGQDTDNEVFFLDRFDVKNDEWWGIYGQVIYDVTDRLQLTLAGRYDDTEYTTTQFTDGSLTTVIPTLDEDGNDEDGNLVNVLEFSDSKFQPKAQISYDVADNMMVYFTYAEGYRAGFFNTSNLTAPEETTNYEVGFKSQWLDGALTVNATAFHIDYSNQQFTSVTTTPPFRNTINIPSSNIDGFELDVIAQLHEYFTFTGGVGYLDSKVTDGTRSPVTPKWSVNLAGSFNYPIIDDLELTSRVDYRYQGSQFIQPGEVARVSDKHFLNLRAGVGGDVWKVTGFVDNALDTRQAFSATSIGAAVVRAINKPRSYGIEVSFRY